MRNVKEILSIATQAQDTSPSWSRSQAFHLAAELEQTGIAVLPPIVEPRQLRSMQAAFAARLKRMRWNNVDGYHKTEPYRHMVEDVLLLDQGFVDLALHPLVKHLLTRYLGTRYELTEAKGWRSMPTKYDFHGWHGDIWYDQATRQSIPREIKLGMYLTDVRSGGFKFVKGSHRRQHPHSLVKTEVENLPVEDIVELSGPAGTVFMFDTSAAHRQSIPILEARQAIFYAYHDPGVPIQAEDIAHDRYHPLLLNAAFLGDLSPEDRRILGFGNKTNFRPAFERLDEPPFYLGALSAMHSAQLHVDRIRDRITMRFRRTFNRSGQS